MKKFFVTVLESGWATYEVQGEESDTIESIRAAIESGSITLDHMIKSDITDSSIDEIELIEN